MARKYCERHTIKKRPSNILVVSFDALRRDFVTTYNPDARCEDNVFSRAAKLGTVYRNALANGNWTIPSHASLFTGLEGQEHGIFNWRECIPMEVETLFDKATVADYRCAFLASKGVRELVKNRRAQFDFFSGTHEGDDQLITEGDRPWCVFWHFLDTHAPYNMVAPGPADLQNVDWQVEDNTINWLRELICTGRTSEITTKIKENLDVIGAKVSQLWSRLGSDTVVVLTSDHGEDFRRHMPFHCSFETTVLKVPMIVSAPGLASEISDELISHADIPSLIWDLASKESNEQRRQSLAKTPLSHQKGRVCICGPDAFDNKELFFATSDAELISISRPSTNERQHFRLNQDQRSRINAGSVAELSGLEDALEEIVYNFQGRATQVATIESNGEDVDALLEQLEKLGYIT